MKKILFTTAIAILAISCVQVKKNENAKPTFNYVADYQTVSTDSLTRGYYQTLNIKADKDQYEVNFSGLNVNGNPSCSFNGKGKIINDTLFVNVGDSTKQVLMYIAPTSDSLGVNVGTKNPDDRYALMYYCSGGATLAGSYYNSTITKDKVGTISRNIKFALLDNKFSANMLKSVDDAKYLYIDNMPALVFTEIDNKICIEILNAMYNTEKGVHVFSKVSDFVAAYPQAEVFANEKVAEFKVKEINASFYVDLSNEKGDFSKATLKDIPSNLRISKITLW